MRWSGFRWTSYPAAESATDVWKRQRTGNPGLEGTSEMQRLIIDRAVTGHTGVGTAKPSAFVAGQAALDAVANVLVEGEGQAV